MPVTLTITSTKPANSQFFGEVSEENNQMGKTLDERIRALPGCLSHTRTVVDDDTRIFTFVFDTIENYDNYQATKTSLPGWAESQEYNSVNGIVLQGTKTIS
jgi:hypothetical protein